MYNKTRKNRSRTGGGCGCDLMRGGGGNNNNNDKRMGPKAQAFANAVTKTLRNRNKKREEKVKAKRAAEVEARRRQAFVAQNVSNVLQNNGNSGKNFIDKLIENPEYADEICDKFCEFLDDLNEMRDEADSEGNYQLSGEISNKKAEIAEKLLSIFGKKAVAAAPSAPAGPPGNVNGPGRQVVNNFGANLANILSGLRL